MASSRVEGEEAEFREAESLAQGHTARKWQRQRRPPGGVAPKARVLSINYYKANKFC